MSIFFLGKSPEHDKNYASDRTLPVKLVMVVKEERQKI
jgi:hypothetical protein